MGNKITTTISFGISKNSSQKVCGSSLFVSKCAATKLAVLLAKEWGPNRPERLTGVAGRLQVGQGFARSPLLPGRQCCWGRTRQGEGRETDDASADARPGIP